MGRYLLRRLLIAIPSLLGISVILFTVLALAPGDPFGELATNPAVPPEVRDALRIKFGLDDPIAIRYFRWIAAMVHGDWGFSFASRIDDALRALRGARRDPARLCHHGARQGPRRAHGDRQARGAQRADPGRNAGRAADARDLRRRDRDRADLPHSGHRLAADQRDPF